MEPTRSAPTTPAAACSRSWCWGARISLLVGLAATLLSMFIGTTVGISVGPLPRLVRRRPRPAHRLVPGHPLPAAGDRPRDGPRALAVRHHHRDRRDLVAGHRAADPRADAVGRGPALPRTGEGARRGQRAPDDAARSAQRHAAGAGQHHARRVDLDPVGDDAVASSASATPTAVSWGSILEQAFASGAISQGAWWYLGSPGVCVVLVVLAFNLIGRAVEDILDPREERADGAARVRRRLGHLPLARRRRARGAQRDAHGRRRPDPRHRRRVRLRQDHADQHRAAPAAQVRARSPARCASTGEDVLDMSWGKVRARALGAGVRGVPGRDARAQPGAAHRRPDRRADPAAQQGTSAAEGGHARRRAARDGRAARAPGAAPTRTSSPAARSSAS